MYSTVICNVKPEKMCIIFKKFIAACKVLVVPELFLAKFERGILLQSYLKHSERLLLKRNVINITGYIR
jgi:hypothetical protein